MLDHGKHVDPPDLAARRQVASDTLPISDNSQADHRRDTRRLRHRTHRLELCERGNVGA
jgi:hypothetical protein